MNRWFGSSDDSQRQAADRNARQARRTLRQLPKVASDSEDEVFGDCNTSLLFVDGANDDNESVVGSDNGEMAAEAAAELARQKALPIEDANFANDEDSWKKEIKLKFEPHDVKYWFNSVEADMKKFGINKQWDKKNSIIPCLPQEVIEECKPILRLTEAEAGDQIYKQLKTEIMSLFGPKDEDAFKSAMALKLTGRPSALGKKLIHKICPGARPFEGCHCARIVYGMWEAHLSAPIKTALAGQSFTAATYQQLFKLADDAWMANGGAAQPAIVAAVTVSTPSADASAESTPQIAAFSNRGGRGRGARGGRGNRGGGRGRGNSNSSTYNNTNSSNSSAGSASTTNSANTKPHQKGPKHPDLPSSAGWACAQHWKKGRGAPYCSDPLVCQWNQVIAPRSST